MTPPPKTDSYAWQASARVLSDPVLWRFITAFQSGLPRVLYDFWVAHEPAVAQSTDRNLIHTGSERLAELVVSHGTVEMLDMLSTVKYRFYKTRGRPEPARHISLSTVSAHAIQANRVEMLEWAIAHNTRFQDRRRVWAMALACYRDGDHRVMDVLRVHRPISVEKLRREVSEVQNVELVRWLDLHFPGVIDERTATDHTARESNAPVAETQGDVFNGEWAFNGAWQQRHLDLLRSLVEKRPTEMDRDVVKEIIAKHDKTATQILVDAGVCEDVVREVATSCIRDGRLEDLKRLIDDGLLPSGKPFSIDEAFGEVKIIRFLTEKHLATATTEAMDRAAEQKNWDVVMYLHEHRSEGCTTRVLDAAAAQGKLNQVKYFHEHRTEGCTTHAMDEAAAMGALSVVQFLHETRSEGCTTRAMDAAAEHGRLRVVKFLHQHRTEGCTTDAMDKAAANGHFRIVQFLHKNRSEGCTSDGVQKTILGDHYEIVRFLFQHYRPQFLLDFQFDLIAHNLFDLSKALHGKNYKKR